MAAKLKPFLARCRQLVDTAAAEGETAATGARFRVVAHVVAHVAEALGVATGPCHVPLLDWHDGSLTDDTRPGDLATPELPGQVADVLSEPAHRHRTGAFYTPTDVARRIVDEALGPLEPFSVDTLVCDPAAGGGAFLLAAARHLAARGVPMQHVVEHCLYGIDVDPLAIAVTQAGLALLAGGEAPGIADHLIVADALGPRLEHEGRRALTSRPFDAVVGNPPFLNQLTSGTSRARESAISLRARFGDGCRAYTDTSNLFLLLALELVRDGGRIGLILPESFLAARDARPTRRAAALGARLEWAWRSIDSVFAAQVDVCATVFSVGSPDENGPSTVARAAGKSFAALDPLLVDPKRLATAPTWSWLFSDARGVEVPAFRNAGTLGDHCRATADFRDQFYGLVPFVFESPAQASFDDDACPKLVTSGLVDPARCLWGRRSTRFAKTAYVRPLVHLGRLRAESTLGPWAAARLVPKLVVSTQTRVLEAAADEHGRWLPSTPVITVVAAEGWLWHLGAVLCSPLLSAIALDSYGGAALAHDAIKLSAAQVAALPTPSKGADWDAAAAHYRAASSATTEREWRTALVANAEATNHAFAIEASAGDRLLEWWAARLPRWRD